MSDQDEASDYGVLIGFLIGAFLVTCVGTCSDVFVSTRGGAGEPCYPNGTCEGALVCQHGDEDQVCFEVEP